MTQATDQPQPDNASERTNSLSQASSPAPLDKQIDDIPQKPPLNEAARIVNSLFLDSDYRGKDWEAVRLSLIKQLTVGFAKAEEKGRSVGQYQAADKLYGHVTTLWLFKDSDDPKMLKMNVERADNLLKDCEKYLNHNRKAYTEYLATLESGTGEKA